MVMNEVEQLNKGGICWFELSIGRGRRGLDFYVKTVPEVENFMKALGAGKKEQVDAYGRDWFSLEENGKLEVYQMDRELPPSPTYTLTSIAEPLRGAKSGKINLSFLRLVGISDPGGVKFGVAGPFSRSFAREISQTILAETRTLIRDYMVPINISLRISTQEL